MLFQNNQTTLIEYPSDRTGSYTIPSTVTNIAGEAFYGCLLLSVTIPASVSTIAEEAFYDCPNLSNVDMANGVASIADFAFSDCLKLTNITIPGSVTNIEYDAFWDSANLAGVYFTGNAPTVGAVPFQSDTHATIYYLPGAIGWAEFSTAADVPTVLWNPVIQTGGGSFGVQNNQFGFNITNPADLIVVVEACTNLANPVWVSLTTNTLVNGAFHFSDPQWTNCPNRFYGLGLP